MMTVGRASDSQRAPDELRAPDEQMVPDAQRQAPDNHRGPVFLAGPDCPDVLFCRFPHIFRDFFEGFGCFRWRFGPRGPNAREGPKTPRGRAPSTPPWLRPCN